MGTYAHHYSERKGLRSSSHRRTTLTLDVTDELKQGVNRLEVKAEHPEMIADMLGYVEDVHRNGDSVRVPNR